MRRRTPSGCKVHRRTGSRAAEQFGSCCCRRLGGFRMWRRPLRRLRIDAPCRGERRRHAWSRAMNFRSRRCSAIPVAHLGHPQGTACVQYSPLVPAERIPLPAGSSVPWSDWVRVGPFRSGRALLSFVSFQGTFCGVGQLPRHHWSSDLPVPSTVPRSRIHNR